MFMSAPAAIPVETFLPDPAMLGEDRPSRFTRLLGLVRKLINYGKELAATLRHPTPSTDLAAVTRPFGTSDIGLILARITRGLLRANALEARVMAQAARPEAPAASARAPAQRAPRAPQPAAAPADEADPRLARLPTPEQIAAEVHRRPVGVVIADICHDLGITPSHPLWRELCLVVIRHGGSLADMIKHAFDTTLRNHLLGCSATPPAASPEPSPPAPMATATSPP